MTETQDRAWGTHWLPYRGDLLRYVGGLLPGDPHTAEDVVQETALRLWQHPEILDDERSPLVWLRTVARNIVIDRVRRRRARPAEVELSREVDGEGRDPFDHVHAGDAMAGVLHTLAPPHRIVVFEVYVRGRGIADVASDLSLPEGTVKSRCHYALRRLRASPALASLRAA